MGTPQTSGWDPHRSVDCRTAAERGAEPPDGGKGGDPRMAGRGTRKIATSRYCGVTSYISCQGERKCKYNDVHVEIDDDAYALLLQSGVDDLLARHVAHLFVRDPLVLFEGMIEELDDAVATDHFENLQSTNWNSVRWKPPPAGASEGRTTAIPLHHGSLSNEKRTHGAPRVRPERRSLVEPSSGRRSRSEAF